MAAAALDIPWPEVRIVALNIGVREAARQFGINENTALARSSVEGWFAHLAPKPLPLSVRPIAKVDSGGNIIKPITGAQVTLNILQKSGMNTKLSAARTIERSVAVIERKPDEELLDHTEKLASLVNSAAKVHGWKDGSQASLSLRVELLSGAGGDDQELAPAIDCESEVVPADPLDGY